MISTERVRYPTIASQTRNSFDSLRLLLALLVIFSHSFPLTRGSNATEPLFRLAAPPMLPGDEITLGTVAVWSFFVISGFLITKSWQRSPSPRSFLSKRVRRIYPGFLVAVSVCALIQAFLTGKGTLGLPGLWNFLSNALQLKMFDSSAVFTGNPFPNVINGSLWSIPYEFWCYLGVMLLGLLALLRRGTSIAGLLCVVVASHIWLDYRGWSPGGMLLGRIVGFPLFWVRVLPFFLAGTFFALVEQRIELRPVYALISAVLLVFTTPFAYLPYVAYPIFGSYLLLYLAFSPALVSLNLGRWGDFSYGVYLYSFPIQQTLIHLFKARLTAIELFFLAAPTSLAAGVLSWFLVERNFLSRVSERRHEQQRSVSRASPSPRIQGNSGTIEERAPGRNRA